MNRILAQFSNRQRYETAHQQFLNLICSRFLQTLKYDISLPSSHYYKIVEETRQLIKDSPEFSAEEKELILPNGHGHVGDGNLHLNVVLPGYDDRSLQERTKSVVEPFVMDYCRKVSGSISAEHGVGQQKPDFLHYSKSRAMI